MGRYDSCYLRAVHPAEPVGLWIRHTFHASASGTERGAHWFTMFTPDGVETRKSSFAGRPSSDPDHFAGQAGDAEWDLSVRGVTPTFEHLPARWMYRAPLPKTKPVSVYPLAEISGHFSVAGKRLVVSAWPGMVGHNWGSEHAHRWIWIHAAGFDGEPDSWIDLTLARLKIGPFVTPWIPNGAISLRGTRRRLGGLLRRAEVDETVEGAEVALAGAGVRVRLSVGAPTPAAVVLWQYADPGGKLHYAANCSIARIRVAVEENGSRVDLATNHRGVYELGMEKRPSGYALQPFPDP